MNDLPGRHDMDTSGIHRPNPYERDDPPWCATCGEQPATSSGRCKRCERNLEEDRMNRELGL